MPIQDRISHSLLEGALPPDSQVRPEDWSSLLNRANNLSFGGARNGLGDSHVDRFEAAGIAGLIESGGHRLYPAEQELSPLLSSLLAAFESDDFVSVPTGDRSLPAAHQSFPESVPVSSITEWDLRPLVERLTQTRPGNDDGDADNLRYTDLDAMPETMTRGERNQVEKIRRKYFKGTVELDWATKTVEVEAYNNADAGVRVVLERTKRASSSANRDGDPTVTGTIRNQRLVISAPEGARIIYQYQPSSNRSGWQAQSGAGITEPYDQGTAPISLGGGSAEPMDYHIMIVHDADGDGPGLPQVLDSFRLQLPARGPLG